MFLRSNVPSACLISRVAAPRTSIIGTDYSAIPNPGGMKPASDTRDVQQRVSPHLKVLRKKEDSRRSFCRGKDLGGRCTEVNTPHSCEASPQENRLGMIPADTAERFARRARRAPSVIPQCSTAPWSFSTMTHTA